MAKAAFFLFTLLICSARVSGQSALDSSEKKVMEFFEKKFTSETASSRPANAYFLRGESFAKPVSNNHLNTLFPQYGFYHVRFVTTYSEYHFLDAIAVYDLNDMDKVQFLWDPVLVPNNPEFFKMFSNFKLNKEKKLNFMKGMEELYKKVTVSLDVEQTEKQGPEQYVYKYYINGSWKYKLTYVFKNSKLVSAVMSL